jgi:SAM-dependent methyltransferase
MATTTSDVPNAFDAEWHWDHIYFDAAPFRYIAEKYQPKSAFDIGCGKGLYLRFLRDLGVEQIQGVDGVDTSVTILDSTSYTKVDLHQPYRAGSQFDVVFCLEVAEHLQPEATDILFDTIAAHAKDLIIFSMAEPGQPGNGHINCLTMVQVLDHWKKRGWTPDLVETLGVRALSTMSWFRRNILVLKPATGHPDDGADDALRKISELTYVWYGQQPGIRQAAFLEPFPPVDAAYGNVQPLPLAQPPLAP